MSSSTTGELRELGLAAAARAIRSGEVSSETYVTTLLERAWEQANLKAFITIDDASGTRQPGRRIDRSERDTVVHCSACL
jgi:indoleacetamide hydrolase